MSDTLTSIRYDLKQPFSYSVSGQMQDAEFIELRAPSSRVAATCADLKQCFLRAATGGAAGSGDADSGKAKETEFTGDMIMMMIGMSQDVELKSFYLHGKNLLSQRGVALIDGDRSITKDYLDNISVEDFEGMLGEYLVNFTLASSLAMMKSL